MEVQAVEVAVFVRVKPTKNFVKDLIECFPDEKKVIIYQRRDCRNPAVRNQQSSLSFQLDGVLQDVPQEEVYIHVAQQVVLGALDGYNGTVMCYGQTGSGKSFTLTGSTESYKQRGIIPRALQEVFQEVERRSAHVFTFHLSYLEIYNESLVDLLSSVPGSKHPPVWPMVVTEKPGGGVFIRGLSLHPVHDKEEALALFFEGEMNRTIASHAMNRNSSRSHCDTSDVNFVTSKLNLVDLAGSERVGKTLLRGQAIKEATYINKSLSYLEQIILALADRRGHVPFRQSKLTHALKDSLGGNSNTVLIANIHGEAAHIEETLSTLRFASRMKLVKTDPAINQHVDSEALIKKLQKEVEILKEELSLSAARANSPRAINESLSEAQLADVQSQVQRYLDGSLREISILRVEQAQPLFAQSKLVVHQSRKRGGGSPVSVKPVEYKSKIPERKNESQVPGSSQNPDRQESQPTNTEPTPTNFSPAKAKAFEIFKLGPGRELNRVLEEMKAELRENKADLLQRTKRVSDMKEEIEYTRAVMQHNKDWRARHGQFVGLEWEILHEVDAALLCLRHAALCSTKAETNYCQHLMVECRVRLPSELEDWYPEACPVEELDKTQTQEEDDGQRQSDLDDDSPDAICFYSARRDMLERRNRRTRTLSHRDSSGGTKRKVPTTLPAP